MKVWVCVIEQRYHLSTDTPPHFCQSHEDEACGPMRIVSAGAAYVKKVDGQWPKAAVKAVQDSIGNIAWRGCELVLDDLARVPEAE